MLLLSISLSSMPKHHIKIILRHSICISKTVFYAKASVVELYHNRNGNSSKHLNNTKLKFEHKVTFFNFFAMPQPWATCPLDLHTHILIPLTKDSSCWNRLSVEPEGDL